MLFITISRTVKYNYEINCLLLGNTFFLKWKKTLRPNWAFLDSHHLEMFPEASQSPFWSLVSENIAGRYGPVYCLRRPAKYFLKYFGIFLENMGGRYGRVYLGLLGINVLHKFLGFLVDAEICQMDKVVRNVLRVVWIRLCREPVCQLLLLGILLDYLFFHELGKLYRRLQFEISFIVTIKQDCLLFHWFW